MKTGLESSVIRVLGRNGEIAGTGFVVKHDLAVTCAHVVEAARGGQDGEIQIRYFINDVQQVVKILADSWSDQKEDDVAFLRLKDLPDEVTPVRLGSSKGRMGDRFNALGFPGFQDRQNHWAQGNLAEIIEVPKPRNPLLQLQGDEILKGMSGAPVLDVDAGVVVGMISEYINQEYARFAYATTVDTLRGVCSELEVTEICPYRGLEAFTESDTQFYFGRERLVGSLLGKLRQNPRCLAVLGPSGSGKSSLVKAGLLPRLRQGDIPGSERWRIQVTRPVELLAQEGVVRGGGPESAEFTFFKSQKTAEGKSARSLLIIDQFEELFVEPDASVRQAFLNSMLDQLQNEPLFAVIFMMRNEFYGQLAEDSPELMELIAQGIMNVPLEMSEEDWRAIILGPAEIVDLRFEEGLVDRILADINQAAVHAPTETRSAKATLLPLVEFALFQLWENRDDGWMTFAGYERIGNLAGNLSQRADETIQNFKEEERRIAERIITDLVHLGDEKLGLPDSRLRRTVDELIYDREEKGIVQGVIERLADAHLIIVGSETSDQPRTVELIHDILLREWGFLASWLEKHRHFLAWRQTLEPRVSAWIQSDLAEAGQRDRGLLLYERDLETAETWLASYPDRLNTEWTGYIQRSLENRKQAESDRRRRQLLLRGLVVAIFILLTGALILFSSQNTRLAEQRDIANLANTQSAANASTAQAAGNLAVAQERTAIAERNIAVTAQALAKAQQSEAEHQALIARAGELAAQAQIDWESHPVRSLLLEIEALRMVAPSQPAADQALRDILSKTGGQALTGHEGTVSALAISPDGRWLASGSGYAVRLWDLSAADPGASPVVLPVPRGSVSSLVIGPDGRWLASGSGDNTVNLWDLSAPDPGASPRVLYGYKGALTISPDGRWLASGSYENTVRLWDLSAADPGASPMVLRGHEDVVIDLAISPDGRWLASGSWDSTLRLWDLSAPDPGASPRVLYGYNGSLSGFEGVLRISPDGRWLASGGYENTVRLWDLSAADPGASPVVLRGHKDWVNALAISPDGRWLASGSADSTVRLWDLSASDPGASPVVLRGHEGSVSALAISPDGRWLASGSYDNTLRLWDLSAADPGTSPVVLRGHEGVVSALAISPDGRWLASGSADSTLRLWDLSAPDRSASPVVLRGHVGDVSALAVSSDGRWLASGSVDHTLRLWDLSASNPGASPVVLRSNEGGVYILAISPDWRWLASGGGEDKTVQLWDLSAADPGASLRMLAGHESAISALAISPDGRWLASGSWDHTVRLWDLRAPDPAASPVVLRGHESYVLALAISPDGRLLASGSRDETVRLWDLSTPNPGASPVVLRGHEGSVLTLAIGPDGRWLASGGGDNTLRLWDLSAEDPAASPLVLRGHEDVVTTLAISPDGRWLASGSTDGTVRLWDLSAPDPGASPVVLRGHEDVVTTLAIGPDGRWLASGSTDGTVRLWDLSAPAPATSPVVLRGHEGSVSALAISPDGRWLASGSADNTLRLWPLDDNLVDIACKTAGRNLTEGEWRQYIPWKEFDPNYKTCPQLP